MESNRATYLVVGATLGAASGWFVGAVIASVINQREALNLMEMVDDNIYTESEEDDSDEEYEEEEKKKPMTKKKRKNNKKKDYASYFERDDVSRPDIAALVRKYNNDTPEDIDDPTEDSEEYDDAFENEEADEVEDNIDTVDPRIISEEEYKQDTSYAHVKLLYFTDDDVLTDQNHEPIRKPENIIGEEALFSFGEQSAEGIVHILNNEKRAMYEVVQMYDAWAPISTRAQKRVKENNDEELGDVE